MAVVVFFLTLLLVITTFAAARAKGTPLIVLLIATVAVFSMATAVGTALAVAQYRALQDADRARAELLALHADIELTRRETGARVHDARALAAAMGAALHALGKSGADQSIVRALSDQVGHLGSLLGSGPTISVRPVAVSEVLLELGSFTVLREVMLIHEAADGTVVLADREQLLAILRNLVDNSRKYAPGSPVMVTCEPAGPFVKLVLEDQGPGIALADAEALFLPGVRRGDGVQGFGMGLAIARSLAEGMHGALWYEPRSGRGSRFVLKLPRPTDEAAAATEEAP